MKLLYNNYSEYYASKCQICHGEKRVKVNDIWTSCLCQRSASLKFKFEQFDIDPPSLKYKSWDDFNGFVDGKQVISTESWLSAKQKALQYCFGSDDPDVIKDRKKNLIVHKHLTDGQNVVIVGPDGSGRTLIAALIIKEVAYACHLHGLSLSFKYIKAHDLFIAARWDNDKSQDHDFLDDIRESEFLVLDEIEIMPPRGHHTNPPDRHTMYDIFNGRFVRDLPTIFICSPMFWSSVHGPLSDDLSIQWGKPFINSLKKKSNLIIEVKKSING